MMGLPIGRGEKHASVARMAESDHRVRGFMMNVSQLTMVPLDGGGLKYMCRYLGSPG